MLDAPTPSVAPNDDAPQRSFAVAVRGLPVSLRGFLQNLHVESLFGHHLLHPDILFSQGFELLRHLRLHAAELMPSAVIRVISLLRDSNQFANFRNVLPLAKLHIRSTQLGDHLIHTVTFLCHLSESFRALDPKGFAHCYSTNSGKNVSSRGLLAPLVVYFPYGIAAITTSNRAPHRASHYASWRAGSLHHRHSRERGKHLCPPRGSRHDG